MVGGLVGEAALSPSALSMMSDYFPPRLRLRAIAIYNTGISLGTGLALIVGGSLIAHVSAAPPVTLPVFGELYAWQTVFLIVGLPGLVMALLMLTVKEPRRQERLHGQPAEPLLGRGVHPELAGEGGGVLGPALVEGVDEAVSSQRMQLSVLRLGGHVEVVARHELVIGQ